MNIIRCLRCGEDLIVEGGLGEQAAHCPRCGQQALDDSLITMATGPTPPIGRKPAAAFGPESYDFLAAAQLPGELGRLGSYRVLRVLGAGGMGVVFEAEDPALQRRVALKAMLPALAASASARQRFVREARAAAAVEHERIVPIFQVGEDRGIPFLVMPLLKGETLELRLSRVGKLPVGESVRIGREIAEALAAAHGHGLIHRDIKPANVWLEGARSTVRLLDFGLARAAETTEAPLSMQGSIYGTPAFMAPEQAHGENVDARIDLFSLGCVLYRMCSGEMAFQGASAITILLAVVGKHPPPPDELAPEVPPALSRLVMQLLAKRPGDRPPSAQAVIDALNGIALPSEPALAALKPTLADPPALDLGPESLFMPSDDEGPMLSATARMQALGNPPTSQHEAQASDAAASLLACAAGSTPTDAGPLLSATARTPKLSGAAFPPDEGPLAGGTARVPQFPPPPPPSGGPQTVKTRALDTGRMPQLPDEAGDIQTAKDMGSAPPARSGSRKILVGVIGLAAVLGLAALLLPPLWNRPAVPPGPVEIGIAYGSEKESWFKEAVADFAATPEGSGIKINLIRVGSLKGGQTIAAGDAESQRIHAWSPAHTIYKAKFVEDWQAKHPGQNPILKEETLCITPMVFVFWKERHDAFIAKYKTVSFAAVVDAMHAKKGWGDIADRPEWGRFRFGLTNPNTSNSALMALLLLACEMDRNLTLTSDDLADKDFRARLAAFKTGLAETAKSTDKLMKDMVTKGPTAFDAVLIYENLAIDYLKAAQGRWGDLHIAYPRRNIWSENPYYILDVPWSSPEQRKAADAFLSFLLSVPTQQKALTHGFRPANIAIPIREHPDSPFVRHRTSGLTVRIDSKCDVGEAAVIDELLSLWGK